MAENASEKRRRHGKGAFALGVIILCFALVGVGFLGTLGVRQMKTLFANTKEKEAYEAFLTPVVMLDTDPFDDVTGADMRDLLLASILSLLTDSDNTPYTFSFVEGETSGLAVPQETVDAAFKKLFGAEVAPVHQSVECSTCIFKYQPSAKRYVVPITGYDPAYAPQVLNIKKSKEGTIELTVGYIAYGDWEMNDKNDFTDPTPAKYRKITLRMANEGYYVSAIRNADVSQLVTTTSETIPTTAPVQTTAPTQTTPTQTAGETTSASQTTAQTGESTTTASQAATTGASDTSVTSAASKTEG